jgi:pimeloyl-ACP methyl ester carboxylesterase/DNA-binding winged helix-turn-helix (wHTH) protein
MNSAMLIDRPSPLVFGPFRLDVHSRRLWREGREVMLGPKALDLLIFLAKRPGEILSRDQIMSAIWPDTFVEDHALTVQIGEIRKALADHATNPAYIETRHRRGYQFVAPLNTEPHGGGLIPLIPRRAELGESPKTRYARSGDLDIAYQVVGEGPVDLIFVMGWISHLEYFWREPSFTRFLRRLASFSRLILFDKRGTGMSDRVPVWKLPDLAERVDDVRAVMEAAGSQRAVLCGVSEGGPMCALFAETYPEKTAGVVMIGTYARRLRDIDYQWGPTPEERQHFLEEIREQWGGPIGLEERAPSVASDRRFREWWATYLRMGASPGAAIALTRMNAEIDVRRVLPAIRCPALVLHRTGDRCLHVEEGRYVAALISGSTYVELPGEDHLPFVGSQDQILDVIERFLIGLPAGPTRR